MDNFQRGKYAVKFSEQVKLLEKRFQKGETYQFLQKELDELTNDFVSKCYRFRIGDIVALKNDCEITPIDYTIDYCFNRIKFQLIIDYAFDGYDKGLNRLELLEIINNSEHFHHIMLGNYIFQSFYGWTKDWKEKRAEHETESYLTLKYDMKEDHIAYFIRNMVHTKDGDNYFKAHEIDYNISRKVDTQDLYFLKDEGGSIKIGISNDVIKRILDLTTAMKQRIDIVKVINNGGKYERVLHRQFEHIRQQREKKVDGYTEWFDPTEELMEFIKNFSPTDSNLDD
jgi:hypothetical protein